MKLAVRKEKIAVRMVIITNVLLKFLLTFYILF